MQKPRSLSLKIACALGACLFALAIFCVIRLGREPILPFGIQTPRSEGESRIDSRRGASGRPSSPSSDDASTGNAAVASRSLVYSDNTDMNAALEAVGSRDWKKARTLLEALLLTDPDNTLILSNLVTVSAMEHKDYKKAQAYLEDLLRIDPDFTGALDRYRTMSIDAERLDRAIAFLMRPEFGNHAEAALTLGRIYREQNQKTKSADALMNAIKLSHPNTPEIYVEIAEVYRRDNYLPQARNALQSALDAFAEFNNQPDLEPKLRKSPSSAQYAFIEVCITLNDPEAALPVLKDLFLLSPNSPKLIAYRDQINHIRRQL